MKDVLNILTRITTAVEALKQNKTGELSREDFIDCIAIDIKSAYTHAEKANKKLTHLTNHVRWMSNTCSVMSNLTDQLLSDDPYTFTEKVFCIDDCIENVKGVSNECRWNGWEMPFFTYDEIMTKIKPQMESNGTLLEYNKEKDAFIIKYQDDDMDIDECEARCIDGVIRYGIGAGSWIWRVQDEDNEETED